MGKNISLKDIKKNLTFLDHRYDSLLEEIETILNTNDFNGRKINIGDAPISPMSLDDSNTTVYLSPEIIQEYKSLIPKLVNPETALEYAYLLVGIKDELENIYIEYIFDIGKKDSINNRSVEYDNERLNNIIKIMSEAGCNFFSLCHTHPLIPIEERKTTITNYLSSDTLENECIRDVGLNLSLQDIINENILNEQIKQYYPNSSSASTVIMYNGELAMFGIEEGQVKRIVNVYDKTTGLPMIVSSSENYKKGNGK